jgi:hypothetical protein
MTLRRLLQYLQVILGIKKDEEVAFGIVTKLTNRLMPSYRFTWPQLGWFHEPNLHETLARSDEATGFNAHRWMAMPQLLRLTSGIPGFFASGWRTGEFSSVTIMAFLTWPGRDSRDRRVSSIEV